MGNAVSFPFALKTLIHRNQLVLSTVLNQSARKSPPLPFKSMTFFAHLSTPFLWIRSRPKKMESIACLAQKVEVKSLKDKPLLTSAIMTIGLT
jgi:hypothetical protein